LHHDDDADADDADDCGGALRARTIDGEQNARAARRTGGGDATAWDERDSRGDEF
jgi:hypothetical protein